MKLHQLLDFNTYNNMAKLTKGTMKRHYLPDVKPMNSPAYSIMMPSLCKKIAMENAERIAEHKRARELNGSNIATN